MKGQLVLALCTSLVLVSGALEHRLHARETDEASGGEMLVPGCNDLDVRLVGGNSSYMGMVEACYSSGPNTSLWGPICVSASSSWTRTHAVAACTQLGLNSSGAASITYMKVPGPYSYELLCNPSNPPDSLKNCVVDLNTPLCTRMIAAGVICDVPESERCETGDVRLVNGSRMAGRLEVCFNGLWGTVCKHQDWSRLHASVVCRELGVNSSAIPIGLTTELYGAGPLTQPILIRDVVCIGNESKISECAHSDINEFGNCLHADDIGVICEAPPGSCSDGDIRLEGGTVGEISTSGNIQVCYTGLWGTVCGTDEDWDEADATVACRQLEYAELDSTELRPAENNKFQSLLSGVNCSGSEKRLADCHHDGVDLGNTRGCKRAYVRCLYKITTDNTTSPPATTPTKAQSIDNAITISSSFGALLLLLVIVVVVVIATLIVLRQQTVRKKMNYSLENARQGASVPAYIQMRSRQASNYLEPVSSRTEMDIYSEWREVLKNLLLSEDQLILTDSLGEGAFGRVYKGTMKGDDGKDVGVAVKTLKDTSCVDNVDNFVKESILMLGFDHPNVLKLLGVCFDTKDHLPLIVLPFMANGDLRSFLMSKRGASVTARITDFPEGLDKQTALAMCLDVSRGMEYLSSSSFVHRDLAARNCMVSRTLNVNIADFGLSRDVYSKDYYRMGAKTMLPVKWMAPESLTDNIFTTKSDVWSYGVVCWEVFSLGSTPYPGVGNHEVLDYITAGRRLKIPTLCTQEMYHIMEMCWNEEPSKRPEFSELVELVEKVVSSCKTEQPHYINMNNGSASHNGHAIQPK